MNNAHIEHKPLPFWKLWANPIFLRYCRSRLRPKNLVGWVSITIIIAGFIFAIARTIGLERVELTPEDAERIPLIPLLIFQGVILFLLATGQVAGAMTAEADEGVLDYQRLAPMSPLSKVLGYLFGLPVREYVLCFTTMPFTLWALWRGEVPPAIAIQLYAAFFVSAILYHLTGLVAGTVVKNRRWAFLFSIGIVFLLYTIIPQMAKVGLVYFQFFTIRPVFEECLPNLIPRTAGSGLETLQNLLQGTRFFNLELPAWTFTFLAQFVLIATAIFMLWRRWNKAESHLLSKVWAVGLFAWTQLLLLGNALPLIEHGTLFPSRALDRYNFTANRSFESWSPDIEESLGMCGLFGTVNILMIWLLTLAITGHSDNQLRGWRRMRKLKRQRFFFGSDSSSSFGWVLAMAITGAIGWYIFTREVIHSHWYPGRDLPSYTLPAFLLITITCSLSFHTLLEAKKGNIRIKIATIVIGVIPILISAVISAASDELAPLAIWTAGISPLAAPLFFCMSGLFQDVLPLIAGRAMPLAFWFWQSANAIVTLILIQRLWVSRRQIKESIYAEPET